jgi:hypothetical protein
MIGWLIDLVSSPGISSLMQVEGSQVFLTPVCHKISPKKGRGEGTNITACLSVPHCVVHSSVICHTTGPQPLPTRFLHLMRSRASSFKWEYPLLSPRSSSNFLRLRPHLLVTSIRPFIFPSITSFRRQFLRKIWPIQLAFRFLISCRIFLCSLTLSNTSSFLTWSVPS